MSLTILVIDDSTTSRAIFRACMPAKYDAEVLEAANMEEAVEQSSQHQFDVCVFDYNLPDFTGIEIAKQLKDNGVDAKFILMTANMQQSVVDRAKELGFVGYIEKPITPEKVASTLEDMEL